MARQAVLLLAHGTPESIDQIPEYLRNVVSGRPLPDHVIEEIKHRYSLIGKSPLTEITMQQGRLVQEELGLPVYVGMRNWRPYIRDVVQQMRAECVEEAAVICMAPQNSRTSVGLFRRAVMAEAGSLRIDFTEGWARHPLLIEAFAERLQTAWRRLSADAAESASVLFTAHSVPMRTVQPSAPGETADPYAAEARHTAELVAAAVPEIGEWRFAFQSQGASGGEWIGPTVEETLDALAVKGARAVILQPIGFLCDHVEILYDVDIAFREYAGKKGIRLERPESLNASSTLARAVADLARQAFSRLEGNARQ